MRHLGTILRLAIIATLLSLLFINLSCNSEFNEPVPERVEVIEQERIYFFHVTERYTRLEYNDQGALFRTHAKETVIEDKVGLTLEELTELIDMYDQELIQEVKEGVSVETWIYVVKYGKE